MLDDMETISKIDKSGMLDIIEKFPEQIKETIDIVNSSNIPGIYKIDHIVISGMGGSAISGDIIQSLFRDKLDIPIFVNREYDLPKWTNKNTLVLSQSYSGNTEETLSTFKHAYQKRSNIIGISSGGKLQEMCGSREVSHIKLPSNIQPRAAIAYILISSILSLRKTGLLKNDIDSEIQETLDILNDLKNRIKKDVPEKDNIAKQMAKKILDTFPHIYGWGFYSPIARRWHNQFNENSKILSRYGEVPECNHNDIIGWSMDPEIAKKSTCILFRDKECESIYMSTRLNFMKRLFDDVAANTIEIPVEGKRRLAKIMYAMYLGDYVSNYLAILRNVDPTPIEAIDLLKNEISRI